MLFLSFSNVNIKFGELVKLTWKFYDIVKVIFTTNGVEPINKIEFAKTAVDKNSEVFDLHIATLKVLAAMQIDFSKTSQILESNEFILAILK